jgi:hypothetical protein
MNEQLIKLGIQAGLMTGEKEQLFFCRPITQFDEYSPEIEKFAELIVKECAEIVAGYYDERTMQWAGPRIAQHFGVKE